MCYSLFRTLFIPKFNLTLLCFCLFVCLLSPYYSFYTYLKRKLQSQARDFRQQSGYGQSISGQKPQSVDLDYYDLTNVVEVGLDIREKDASTQTLWVLYQLFLRVWLDFRQAVIVPEIPEPGELFLLNEKNSDLNMKGISILQDLLDASFDLLAEGDLSDVQRLRLFPKVAPLLDDLEMLLSRRSLQLSSGKPLGSLFYLRMKFADFLASSYRGLGDINAEIESLFAANSAWANMHEVSWYGSGNGVSDPFREGVILKARLGSLLCSRKEYITGLSVIEESILLTDEVWSQLLARDGLGQASSRPLFAGDRENFDSSFSNTAFNPHKIFSQRKVPEGVLDALLGSLLSAASCILDNYREDIIPLSIGPESENDEVVNSIRVEKSSLKASFYLSRARALVDFRQAAMKREGAVTEEAMLDSLSDELSLDDGIINALVYWENRLVEIEKNSRGPKNKKWMKKKKAQMKKV